MYGQPLRKLSQICWLTMVPVGLQWRSGMPYVRGWRLLTEI